MRYGGIEWQYAEPIARALVEVQEFRTWVLKQTRFAAYPRLPDYYLQGCCHWSGSIIFENMRNWVTKVNKK